MTGRSPDSAVAETRHEESLVSIVRLALGAIRRRPWLLVPFVLAGLVGAASSLARLESPYPVGTTPFPREGVVHLPIPILPPLEPVVDLDSTALLGLKPDFFALLLGWQVAIGLATTVPLAVVLWNAVPGRPGIAPPRPRIGWLFAYVLALQSGLFALLYAQTVVQMPSFVLLTVFAVAGLLALAVFLFLTPACIVLGGSRPIPAMIDSADHAVRPLSIAGLILGLGYLGYGLTAIAQLVPSSAAGVALGTVVSVSVAGTLYAVVVAVAYRCWVDTD